MSAPKRTRKQCGLQAFGFLRRKVKKLQGNSETCEPSEVEKRTDVPVISGEAMDAASSTDVAVSDTGAGASAVLINDATSSLQITQSSMSLGQDKSVNSLTCESSEEEANVTAPVIDRDEAAGAAPDTDVAVQAVDDPEAGASVVAIEDATTSEEVTAAVIEVSEPRVCEDGSNEKSSCNEECCMERQSPYHTYDGTVIQATRQRVGKKNEFRSFQSRWYDEFPWLYLCVTKKKVLCFTCKSAIHSRKISGNTSVEASFTRKGFNNWKKARFAFKQHQFSDLHKEATFKQQLQAGQGVNTLLEHHGNKVQSVRRRMLLEQLGCLRFLLRQGLAIRGHVEVEGNLRQLLKLKAGKDDEDITNWLRSNDYLSPLIVNETIQIMGHTLLRSMLHDIREAGPFAIMADETRDLSNKEQLSICIRWVDAGFTIHEDLIGFIHVIHTDADTLTKAIKDVLLRCSLPLSQCRGQGYDGASNMMGHLRGVAAQIRKEEPAAIHVHCWAHCLNLCLQDAAKTCHIVRDSLYVVGEISKLINNSPKRSAIFLKLKEKVSPESPGLRPLCPTRWTVRTGAIEGVLSNYEALVDTMSQISEECHDDFGTRARGLQNQMEKFDTYFGLKLCHLIFSTTEELSRLLQGKQTTLEEASRSAEVLTQFLQRQREAATFSLFYEEVKEQCMQVVGAEPRLPRMRAPPKRLDDGVPAHRFANPEEYYRRMYCEAIDLVVGEMGRRFEQESFQVPRDIERTVIAAANWNGTGPQVELGRNVTDLYKEDLDHQRLQRQLNMLPELVDVARQNQGGLHQGLLKVTTVRTVVDIILESPGGRQMFSEVVKLVKIFMTLPVSTATAERSFSALRRLKTYLRTTMSQQRLNHVALANCHKERLDNVDLIQVAKDFVSVNDRRQRYFGQFD